MRVAKSIRQKINQARKWRGKKNGVIRWLFDDPWLQRAMAKDRKRFHGPRAKVILPASSSDKTPLS